MRYKPHRTRFFSQLRKEGQSGARRVYAHAIRPNEPHSRRVGDFNQLFLVDVSFFGTCFLEASRIQYGSLNSFGGTFLERGKRLVLRHQNNGQINCSGNSRNIWIGLESVNLIGMSRHGIYFTGEALIQE